MISTGGLQVVDPELDSVPQLHRHRQAGLTATRTQLYEILETVLDSSAACAMAQSAGVGPSGALSFTLAELAHVVTRHVGCVRERLHGEEVMGPLGLKAYTFRGDV